ncbi:MAG: bifunctional precorrin-2 dehydrogenase/sirohydrochlorin ferrochelatase [Flavobacteriaceae bacterium]
MNISINNPKSTLRMDVKQNSLYPVFLKMNRIQTLIVGGGDVALEKLSFLLKSSPNANIVIVAPSFHTTLIEYTKEYPIKLISDNYDQSHLEGKDLVIAATNRIPLNQQIFDDVKKRGLLINVADSPSLCDFYLGGIVTKGDLKIAFSTNGKSPTTAKILRQFFEGILPEQIEELIYNLNLYRKEIKGTLKQKVEQLNTLTKQFLP